MWPFRRKVESPAADGAQPVPAPVIRRDWAGLAPIQRVIGAHPLTAPSDRFSDDLATHQDPSVSSDTMGHQVSADAPAGLVLALARPTTRSDGPAMIPRPRVQRREVGAVAESGESDGDEAAPESARPTPLPASQPTVAARELPVVTPQPAVQRLISLSPDAEPTPAPAPRQRSGALPMPLALSRSADELETLPAPAPRLSLGQSRKLGLGAPIRRVPDRSVQRANDESAPHPAPESQATARPVTPSAALEAAPLPTSAPPSVPLSSTTPSPVVARDVDRTVSTPPLEPTLRMARVSPLEPTDELRLDLPLARRPTSEQPPAGDAQIEPPALPVQTSSTSSPVPSNVSSIGPASAGQRGDDDGSPSGSFIESQPALAADDRRPESTARATTSSLSLAPPSLARLPTIRRSSAPTAAAATAPIVSARPLRPTATLQRSWEPAPADLQEPISRAVDADLAGRRALTDGEDMALPSSHGSLDTAPGQSLFAHELTRVAQRRYGLELPDEGSPDGDRPEPLAQSVGRSVSRAATLPLAPVQRAAAETSLDRQAPGSDATSDVVQRGLFDSVSSEFSSMTSRQPSLADAGSAVSTVGSAIGSMFGGKADAKDTEKDMDELAGKLYDRIRSRLKTELLVDRERAGFLTDLR